jgi:hypothetical protein
LQFEGVTWPEIAAAKDAMRLLRSTIRVVHDARTR